MKKAKIKSIIAREILDSRGNPTLEVKVILSDGTYGKASVPSGASTGKFEALELRDKNRKRYNGKGVLKAINNVNKKIAKLLKGKEVEKQQTIDKAMIELDGTSNKSNLGANAILGVSLAIARAGANFYKLPLYIYLRKIFDLNFSNFILPVPLMNIINGGKHADNNLDFQEFMIVPKGFSSFSRALQAGVEIFHQLKEILRSKKLFTGVGDEGGFAPNLSSNQAAIELIIEAILKAGYKPDKEVFIALDVAASSFWKKKDTYQFKNKKNLSTDELIKLIEKLIKTYPIISIEDPIYEDDWDTWKAFTEKVLKIKNIQIVGDDLFVTNPQRIKKGIDLKVANAVLIKLNQIGTLTETIEAVKLAQGANYRTIISHRSGETTDDFIADLAVALNTGQIKTGSLSRGERICKYNRLLEIEIEEKTKFKGGVL